MGKKAVKDESECLVRKESSEGKKEK